MLHHLGRILEGGAADRDPVVIIQAGKSKNGNVYPLPMLRESAAKFEVRPVCIFSKVDADGNAIFDHQRDDAIVGREVLNQVGHLESCRWDAVREAIVADLVWMDTAPAKAARDHVRALRESGGLGSIGLSINAVADMPDGVTVRAFEHVVSVDIVTHPAAGGCFGHRIAASFTPSRSDPMKLFDALKLKCPRLVEGLSASDSPKLFAKHFARRVKENQQAAAEAAAALGFDLAMIQQQDPETMIKHFQAMIEMVKVVHDMKGGDEGGETPPAPPTPPPADGDRAAEAQRALEAAKAAEREAKAVERRARIRESQAWLREKCTTRGLPPTTTARVLEAHKETVLENEAAADAIAKAEQEYVDTLIGGSRTPRIEYLRESRDKDTDALAYLFSDRCTKPPEGDPRRDFAGSFHAFLRGRFGIDVRESILHGQESRRRVKEAIDGTTFNEVFADSINRAVQAEYMGHERFGTWRNIVNVVSHNDFRPHHVINVGYYGDLPTVAEGAAYLALTSPTDREETITLAKKGGTEQITLEKMLNDDLGLWKTIVRRIGRGAAETAFNTVFALLRKATPPTMSDTNKLTSAVRTPNNETTTALDKAALIAGIKQMMAQTGGSGHKKGVMPRYCVIPLELLEAYQDAVQTLRAGMTGTEIGELLALVKGAVPGAIVDYRATDTNDWFLIADPRDSEVIRFATLGGREEPEIFISDNELFGDMFTNDLIKLKVRFIYQAAAVDWVGVQGNIVA